jgi:hypothetical protein
MESKLSKWEEPKEQDFNTGSMVSNGFLFLVIELELIFNLVHSIRGQASPWHVAGSVASAATFQVMLVMAVVTYRRIWRTLRSTGSFNIDSEKLLGRIEYLVMCLLFALMFYPIT